MWKQHLDCVFSARLLENDNTLRIKNEKTRSLLLFTNVTEKHFGNYTCFASNRLGASNASMLLFSEYTQTIVKLFATTFSRIYKSTKVQCQECINTPGENNMHICYCALSALSVLTKNPFRTKMHASISLLDVFCIPKKHQKCCLFFVPRYIYALFFSRLGIPFTRLFLPVPPLAGPLCSLSFIVLPFSLRSVPLCHKAMISLPPSFALSFCSSHYRPQWVISLAPFFAPATLLHITIVSESSISRPVSFLSLSPIISTSFTSVSHSLSFSYIFQLIRAVASALSSPF